MENLTTKECKILARCKHPNGVLEPKQCEGKCPDCKKKFSRHQWGRLTTPKGKTRQSAFRKCKNPHCSNVLYPYALSDFFSI